MSNPDMTPATRDALAVLLAHQIASDPSVVRRMIERTSSALRETLRSAFPDRKHSEIIIEECPDAWTESWRESRRREWQDSWCIFGKDPALDTLVADVDALTAPVRTLLGMIKHFSVDLSLDAHINFNGAVALLKSMNDDTLREAERTKKRDAVKRAVRAAISQRDVEIAAVTMETRHNPSMDLSTTPSRVQATSLIVQPRTAASSSVVDVDNILERARQLQGAMATFASLVDRSSATSASEES